MMRDPSWLSGPPEPFHCQSCEGCGDDCDIDATHLCEYHSELADPRVP